MNGVFVFEVGEPKKTIGFKFGTMALGITEKEEGRSLKSILEDLTSGKVTTMMLLNIMYGAAIQYADSKKVSKDFTVSEISDWCEEIGFEEVQRVMIEGFKQYVPKNSKSLAETREMTTA